MHKGIDYLRDDKANEDLHERPRREDSELIDDLALAEQALEDYETHGIERTTLYSEYRAKRLDSKTSQRE